MTRYSCQRLGIQRTDAMSNFNDNVRRVKDAANIVDIIGEFVELRPSGKNYTGLCPFHNEKTPSFVVSEERQSFKCFGCDKGGDVITFIMERDNMEFMEALKYLADKVHIALDNTSFNRRTQIDREKYYKINQDAMNFFFENLLVSKIARDYLRERQLGGEAVNAFRLGYALDSWDSLLHHMTGLGHKLEDLATLGLVGKSQRGNYYDLFRNRLIFPIVDIRNRVIGFGGRALGEDRAKYINSPETPVYHKGDNLYAINHIHQSNQRERLVLVEGYMDVIGLWQGGIDYSVAGLGTALTQAQAKLAARYANQIYICFDYDPAGLKATLAALEVFESIKKIPRVIILEEGLDPDDYILKYGSQGFEKAMEAAQSPTIFRIENAIMGKNLEDPMVLNQLIPEIREAINKNQSQIVRDDYTKYAADLLRVDYQSLRADMAQESGRETKKTFVRPEEKKSRPRRVPPLITEALILASRDKTVYDSHRAFIDKVGNYGYNHILEDLNQLYKDEITFEDFITRLPSTLREGVEEARDYSLDDYQRRVAELDKRLQMVQLQEELEKLQEELSMLMSLADGQKDTDVDDILREKMSRYQEVLAKTKTSGNNGGIYG